MNNLAAVLYLTGRYDENVATLQKALPIYREVYGSEHPEVEAILNNMGRSMLMAGHVQEAVPFLRQAVAMSEKLKGPTHDDLVPPLNSLAMIDAFIGDTAKAQAEISRAEQIARLPDHGTLLDQVLLNRADLELRDGSAEKGAASLQEARRLLEAAFPLAKRPSEAWRYAVWDTVNAELLAQRGDAAAARRTIEAAIPPIAQRFGKSGFYSLLAQQRARFVEDATSRASRKL
jgi:tetratricopeptide (TPR) repeat protein